jgi:hypothetical protein
MAWESTATVLKNQIALKCQTFFAEIFRFIGGIHQNVRETMVCLGF